MAEVPDIQLSVKDFRAIKSADIIINGITVVAGENGSGKSSISKLLYFLYKTVANYEKIVKQGISHSLRDFFRFVEILHEEIRVSTNKEFFEITRKEIHEYRRSILRGQPIKLSAEKILDLIEKLESSFLIAIADAPSAVTKRRVERVKHILRDIVDSDDDYEEPIERSFAKVKAFIRTLFNQAEETIELRPTSVFKLELEEVFSEGDLPEKFEVQEYGSPIVSLDSEHLSMPYSIQNAIYIDSPMMFHADISKNIHWEDLSELLGQNGNTANNISEIISKEIMQGEVIADENFRTTDDFKFKRADEMTFDLIDVATGIKAFSILQLLLKNGLITDKTLMIIDEPESHLHPQWIIEYARIIVMLNKQIGVKFFIASHDPDMVSALRYISEKEGTLDKVNFYLAQKTETKFKYNYKHLGNEIDPIFESFNIALERINKYGI